MADSSTNPVVPAIDWSAVSAEVKCPLCRYNLRGLNEPRCPECGHGFEWAELFNPQRPDRLYFEHQRGIRPFLRTLFAGLRTRRFWLNLRPSQTIFPRRLIIYWLLCSLFLLLLPVAGWLRMGLPLASYNAAVRRDFGPNANYRSLGRQKFLKSYLPLPPSPEFFKELSHRVKMDELWTSAGADVATILLWPWLTLLTLMIFQAPMPRAQVPRLHVLRCVIYSSDLSVWYVLFMFLTMSVTMVLIIATSGRISAEMRHFARVPILLLWLFRLDRLGSAYRIMGFDSPFLTALSSQIIVAMALFMGLLWTVGWIW